MEWIDYLKQKKIDPEAFSGKESKQYEELEKVFSEMSEFSFTSQKKFILNPLRMKFPFIGEVSVTDEKPKVKIKPKPIPGIVKTIEATKESNTKIESQESVINSDIANSKPKPKFRPKIKKK